MKQRVTISQIEAFLRATDKTFPVSLSQKQDLSEYARKLYERATLCAISIEDKVVSLVAGYTDDLTNDWAYIAIVATLPEARGNGYAKKLIQEFISICEEKHIMAVHLYAVPDNVPAMNMYYSLGFQDLRIANEVRKEDAHLIYYLKDY